MIFEEPRTWRKYREGLCNSCQALCCRLPVEVAPEELVTMGLATADEVELGDKYLQKIPKLKKIIKRYNRKSNKFLLEQTANNDCIFLDKHRRCSIYDQRPQTCRNHPEMGHVLGIVPIYRGKQLFNFPKLKNREGRLSKPEGCINSSSTPTNSESRQ